VSRVRKCHAACFCKGNVGENPVDSAINWDSKIEVLKQHLVARTIYREIGF
jgi:hypothetical protein